MSRYTNDEVVAMLFSFEQFITDHYQLIAVTPVGKVRIYPEPGKLVQAWQQKGADDDLGGSGTIS